MPTFTYRGADDGGVERKGEIEASGVLEASDRLRSEGICVLHLERAEPPEPPRLKGEMDAFSFFNRSLAEMTRIGFPLPQAVREASRGLRRGRFKEAIDGVEAALREGKSMDEAVGDLRGEFPPTYRHMLKAGAASGNLPRILAAVARNSEGIRRARRALVSALAYPAVILAFGALLMGAFFAFILPLFTNIQEELGFEPSMSISVAKVVRDSASLQAVLIGGIVTTVILAWLVLTRTIPGERFLYGVPILGRIRRNLFLSRLLGSLGMLLRARVPLPEALPVALGASGSLHLARENDRLTARASEGASLSDVLREGPVMPPEVTSYLRLAERTGDLPRSCEELADLLMEQAVAESDTLYVVLLPTALLVTGGLVCLLVVSVVAPYVRFLEEIVK